MNTTAFGFIKKCFNRQGAIFKTEAGVAVDVHVYLILGLYPTTRDLHWFSIAIDQ